jgi:hypothetical protein
VFAVSVSLILFNEILFIVLNWCFFILPNNNNQQQSTTINNISKMSDFGDNAPSSPGNVCLNLSSSLSKLTLPDDMLLRASNSADDDGDHACNSRPKSEPLPCLNASAPLHGIDFGSDNDDDDDDDNNNNNDTSDTNNDNNDDSAKQSDVQHRLSSDHTPPTISPRLERARKRSRASGDGTSTIVAMAFCCCKTAHRRLTLVDAPIDCGGGARITQAANAADGVDEQMSTSHTILFQPDLAGRQRTSSFSGAPELQVCIVGVAGFLFLLHVVSIYGFFVSFFFFRSFFPASVCSLYTFQQQSQPFSLFHCFNYIIVFFSRYDYFFVFVSTTSDSITESVQTKRKRARKWSFHLLENHYYNSGNIIKLLQQYSIL